jgi:Trypsin-like peptidase domain
MKITVPLTLCAVLISTSIYSRDVIDWHGVRMASQDSVAYVETEWTAANRVISGTGFLISSGSFLITASHVVPEPEDGKASEYRAALKSASAARHKLQLISRIKEHDVALLEFSGDGLASAGLKMQMRSLPEEDDELYTLGFPTKTASQTGAMSGVNGMLSNKYGPGGLWQTTLPLNRGNSGGPVFDKSGRVVAVAIGGYDDAHQITFVRPIYQLVGILQQLPLSVNVDAVTPELQVTRNEALDDEIEKYITDVWLWDREVYAARVDYFKYGEVDRTFIADEKKRYAERWPTRRYSLILGTLKASKIGEAMVVATFRFSYRVSNPTRSLSGEGAAEVVLQKTSEGEYEVRSAKEILFR